MDDLLARVERPSRYLGREPNAVHKDPASVGFRVALAYPDLYEIGMSNTGLHILYHMLNEAPDVACERVYLPARDLEALLVAEGRPLATLESRTPLAQVDILGVQIPHELSYANIVKLLRLARVPLWAAARGAEHPLVLGGGPGVFGAEPVAPFYDAMLLGDAEEALWEVVRVTREHRARKAPRDELLLALAGITGVYVPAFYRVRYDDEGRVAAIEPRRGAPPLVLKAVVEDLEGAYYPDTAIVPYAETVHSRLPVEVMRGCTVGCRFCQAGMIYRPLRERTPRRILDLAKCGLGATGFEDISLLSLDTGDYTLIDPLTKELLRETADKRVSLSLPSLRAGSLTDDVIRDIQRVRRTSFTIAPEAGTQRLRDVINKNISDEEIFETVERVARAGWSGIKLYFMVGFPTERQSDLDGLVELVDRCRRVARAHVRRFDVTASLGTLVPKPHTPFQWDAQLSADEARRRLRYVARALKARRMGCKYHDPVHSWMEGIFSRGDRRLAPVIAAAEARGAGFESWSDQLRLDVWRAAFADHGIDPDWYLRERGRDEPLPWDHLSARVTKKYLQGERRKVDQLERPTTFDCRDDLCAGCSTCFTDDVRNRLAKYHPDPFRDGRRLPIALTSRVAMGHGVAEQWERAAQAGQPRDQAAQAGADALEAKRRRRRPRQPNARRWHVTPGSPGAPGPAEVFVRAHAEGDPEVGARREQEELAREAERARAAALEAEAAGAGGEGPSAPPAPARPARPGQGPCAPQVHYRVRYARRGDLRWLSHRETTRTLYRAAQRSGLPLHYNEGYHPKPKLAFGPPLPVGSESEHEELDLFLEREEAPERVLEALRRVLPPGLDVASVARFEGKTAHAERLGGRWAVDLASIGLELAAARAALARWDDPAWDARIEVERPGRARRTVDLRVVLVAAPALEGPGAQGVGPAGRLVFSLRQDEGSAKPYEVTAALLGLPRERTRAGRFTLVEALLRPGVARGGAPSPARAPAACEVVATAASAADALDG